MIGFFDIVIVFLVTVLKSHIFTDLRGGVELAFSWLYQEYAMSMNMVSVSGEAQRHNMTSYDECLTIILDGLLKVADTKEA